MENISSIVNVSLNGEELTLNSDTEFIVIDALYLDDIRKSMQEADVDSLKNIKERIFPYNDFAFGVLRTGEGDQRIVRVKDIKKEKYNDMGTVKETCYFSSDTGLLVIVATSAFKQLVRNFDYDRLIDSLTDEFNKEYWMSICSLFNIGDIGLIFSPGVGYGFEFEGSGTYSLRLDSV